jgi:MSHA biogenesis protein MshE
VQSELEYALALQATTGQRLGDIVVELGLATEQTIVELLSEQLRVDLFDANRLMLDTDTARVLPEAEARRLRAIPIRRVDALTAVAVAEPADATLVSELIKFLKTPVRLFAATRDQVDELITLVHGRG